VSVAKPSHTGSSAAPPLGGAPGLRILLVDDRTDSDRISHELAKVNLQCELRRVADRTRFEEELEAFAPNLILADYRLKEFSALEALSVLKARGLDIAVIVITEAHSEAAAVEGLGLGAEDYVAKPTLARLPGAVLNLVKRKEAERQKLAAQEALRRSEERYRVIISERERSEIEIERLAAFPRNNPNPVLAFAADGSLAYFNQSAQTLAEQLGKGHPRDILPLNIVAEVKRCLASGQGSLRLENVVGNRTLSWSLHPVQEGQVVHCYAEEITGRLELETKLRQLQKMESIGQLAAGIAHDFNNILTIIRVRSELLLAGEALSAGQTDALKQVAHAADRGASLTSQLLMFSRKKLAQRQLMDLNDAIKESGKMLRVLVGDAIQLQLHSASHLPPVYADSGMIQQILINLAANARDAMPKGGQLSVSAACVEVPPDRAERVPRARPGRFVCLSVGDTGCGMDAATREHIFEPFFTTKEPGQGTGLGLATVYGIVEQHEGWLEVESEPGQGTTFKIYFPAASKAVQHEVAAVSSRVRGGHETVLVVEDEPGLRELVLEILQQYGYKTLEAANGVQALKIWGEKKDQIDLVLTDIMMPEGVSGRDLAEKILAVNPQMKIIYTSGYPMDVLGRDFFQKEGLMFLQKPYQPQTLARMVREYLDA
jgi:two-component system, cell cycle sensor histidine kinase and response regulator CckA